MKENMKKDFLNEDNIQINTETQENNVKSHKKRMPSEITYNELCNQKLEKSYMVNFYINILKKLEELEFNINLCNLNLNSSFDFIDSTKENSN